MLLTYFTLLHVIISIAAILSGLVVVFGLIERKQLDGWTSGYLTAATLTSVTGFFFPFHGLTPALAMGLLSLLILIMTSYARYVRRLAGGWRRIYVIGAVTALYLNVFVLIVQLFMKVPALKALAPKQNEPPFAITQLVVLGLFIALGTLALIRFKNSSSPIIPSPETN
ncbi:MAG TPA: hypothetical protein VGO57_06140 [Verrucomicrobiae bacterium]|jgi:hypothetical protein